MLGRRYMAVGPSRPSKLEFMITALLRVPMRLAVIDRRPQKCKWTNDRWAERSNPRQRSRATLRAMQQEPQQKHSVASPSMCERTRPSPPPRTTPGSWVDKRHGPLIGLRIARAGAHDSIAGKVMPTADRRTGALHPARLCECAFFGGLGCVSVVEVAA